MTTRRRHSCTEARPDHRARIADAGLRCDLRGRLQCVGRGVRRRPSPGHGTSRLLQLPLCSAPSQAHCLRTRVDWAVRHWCPYLWGRPFLVHTDHYSLKFLLDQRLSTVPQHQWISKLFSFDFTVEYRPGRLNTVADALSRHDADITAVHPGHSVLRFL